MADTNNYPDEWNKYCKRVRRKDVSALTNWNRFAARYRAASSFSNAEFWNVSKEVARGYSNAIKLLLAYSAFEAACKAAGKDHNKVILSSEIGIYKQARIKLLKAFGLFSESDFPIRQALNGKLAKRVDDFFLSKTDNLQPVAASLRHLFAHGIWTPVGAKALTKGACDALDLLSQRLLHGADALFNEYLDHLEQKSKVFANFSD
jgi:hypothetical protein